ncbi:MAG: hypothetical protein AAGB35_05895 [Pseudomonadota bacterium]
MIEIGLMMLILLVGIPVLMLAGLLSEQLPNLQESRVRVSDRTQRR